MVRSLYSGVAGLTVHQTRMDVIGNNIANVNTYGFKASRTSFSDIYYQSKKSASGGTAVFAGNNESAVGYGVEISSIDKDMSASSFQTTNRVLDIAISGDGMFMVGTLDDNKQIDSVNYTRYGNFGVDSEGNLVNTLNQFVLGTKNTATKDKGTYSAKEMAAIKPADNPPDLDTINVNDLVWDAFKKYTKVEYKDVPQSIKTKSDGNPNENVKEIKDPDDPTKTIIGDKNATDDLAAGDILYLVNGKYVNEDGVVYDTEKGKYLDEEGREYDMSKTEVTPATDPKTYNRTYTCTGPEGSPLVGIGFLYDPDMKQFKGTSEGKDVYTNMKMSPLKYSDLDGFSVGTDGVLTATFAGQIKSLARLELATFDNVEGLAQVGETEFGESTASGRPNVKSPGKNGTGTVKSSKLEMSNVNLASEFSDMIVTQRGFQANARIITTSDSMLEELVNLKR